MVMVWKFSNFPDELSENDELREYELSGSDSTLFITMYFIANYHGMVLCFSMKYCNLCHVLFLKGSRLHGQGVYKIILQAT